MPEDTSRVARAAFPKRTPYLMLRDELGVIFTDEDFADLFPQRGQPALAPWRFALVTVMQFRENVSDRQAAEAVRARIDLEVSVGTGTERCRIRLQCAQRVSRAPGDRRSRAEAARVLSPPRLA